MCVANKKWPSAEHTQTHAAGSGCVTGADWQQQSYLWGRRGVGPKKKAGWHQSFAQVPPNLPCECKTDTYSSTLAAVVFFSHPETVPSPPRQALSSEYLWNLWGGGVFWRHFVAMKQGCVTETDKYLPELNRTCEQQDGFTSYTVNHLMLHNVYVCTWLAQMCALPACV